MGSTVRQCISVELGDNEVVSFVGSTRLVLLVRRAVLKLYHEPTLAHFSKNFLLSTIYSF